MMIGDNIKYFAERRGMSPYKLAKETEISNSYLSDLINGKQNNPSIDIIKKISKALDVAVDELISERSD
nr:MAG TPA: helix-turn-helix domain protein [Caudoviricetes sp.]